MYIYVYIYTYIFERVKVMWMIAMWIVAVTTQVCRV